MLAIILCLFRFFRLLCSGHQAVAVENLALRLQLAAFKRKRKRPVLTQLDRLFWAGLSQFWNGWRGSLVSFGRIQWSDGSAIGSGDSGPACRNPSMAGEDGLPWLPRRDVWSCRCVSCAPKAMPDRTYDYEAWHDH